MLFCFGCQLLVWCDDWKYLDRKGKLLVLSWEPHCLEVVLGGSMFCELSSRLVSIVGIGKGIVLLI